MADVEYVSDASDTDELARDVVDELAEELGYNGGLDYLFAFATEEGRDDMRQRIAAL